MTLMPMPMPMPMPVVVLVAMRVAMVEVISLWIVRRHRFVRYILGRPGARKKKPPAPRGGSAGG